jgi:hypothetical protein
MRRLSIVDLAETGDQPIPNEDDSRLSGPLTNVVGLRLWDEQFVRGCRPGRERPVE